MSPDEKPLAEVAIEWSLARARRRLPLDAFRCLLATKRHLRRRNEDTPERIARVDAAIAATVESFMDRGRN